MRFKIEAEANLSDQKVIESLDSDATTDDKREEILANLEGCLSGAEFPIEIEGVRFMINVTDAQVDY